MENNHYWATVSVNAAEKALKESDNPTEMAGLYISITQKAFEACRTPQEVSKLYCELAGELNQQAKHSLAKFTGAKMTSN